VTSLLSRSLRDFLAAVASETEPVPAGACAAALTGAASAALVVLVCRVLERRREPPDVTALRKRAAVQRASLEALIDADASAYDAFASAPREQRTQALADATRTPLDIAAACLEVATLARSVEVVATGAIRSDVDVALTLATAAAEAALSTASHNIAALGDTQQAQSLKFELDRLRVEHQD
jgi:formiminotetrahydrofolate cyclodeaminase